MRESRAICLADKLVIRKAHELTSEKVGNLVHGKTVLVLEQRTLDDGTVRARIGKMSSPRGLLVDSLGWVTCRKEAEEKLQELSEDDINDADWRIAMDEYNYRKDCDMAARVQTDSMASRIAQRRRTNRSTRSWLSYSEQAEIILPALLSQRPPSPPTAATQRVLERLSSRKSSSGGAARLSRGGKAAPSFQGAPEEHPAWMDAPALAALAEDHWEMSRSVETRYFDTFAERLGLMLQVRRAGWAGRAGWAPCTMAVKVGAGRLCPASPQTPGEVGWAMRRVAHPMLMRQRLVFRRTVTSPTRRYKRSWPL